VSLFGPAILLICHHWSQKNIPRLLRLTGLVLNSVSAKVPPPKIIIMVSHAEKPECAHSKTSDRQSRGPWQLFPKKK
jgi:hypothetical protein